MANLKCRSGKNGNFFFASENFIRGISLIFVNFFLWQKSKNILCKIFIKRVKYFQIIEATGLFLY